MPADWGPPARGVFESGQKRYERRQTALTIGASIMLNSMSKTGSERGFPAEIREILESLGVSADRYTGGTRIVRTPLTGEIIGEVRDYRQQR